MIGSFHSGSHPPRAASIRLAPISRQWRVHRHTNPKRQRGPAVYGPRWRFELVRPNRYTLTCRALATLLIAALAILGRPAQTSAAPPEPSGSAVPERGELSPAELATAERLAAGVTIYRDAYGVPHVDGETDAAAAFGFAYAQAEDYFWQIEDSYILSLGRYAEVHGSRGLNSDLLNRDVRDRSQNQGRLSRGRLRSARPVRRVCRRLELLSGHASRSPASLDHAFRALAGDRLWPAHPVGADVPPHRALEYLFAPFARNDLGRRRDPTAGPSGRPNRPRAMPCCWPIRTWPGSAFRSFSRPTSAAPAAWTLPARRCMAARSSAWVTTGDSAGL